MQIGISENRGRLLVARDDLVADIWASEDGLLTFDTKPQTTITLEAARALLEAAVPAIDRARPSLVLMQRVVRVERGARALFASEEYMQLSSQTALVVDTPISRVIGNFFLGIHRPRYPVRLFDDVPSAQTWLRSFVS